MRDLAGPDDCRALVDRFYTAVRTDPLLGPIFASRIDAWDDHLATMARFWSAVLFARPGYDGNPMHAHLGLPLEPEHFARWLALWRRAVDDLFAGPRADDAITRAERIARVLAHRLVGAAR